MVTDKDKSDIVILFCPIVSRFECDITAALSYAKDNNWNNLVLVAMHHTFDKAYVLPQHRNIEGREIQLLVECLFYENTGLLKCPRNKEAQKMVCQELGLTKSMCI